MPTPASRHDLAAPDSISTAVKPALVDRAADYDIPKLWRDRDEYGRPRSIARSLTSGERSVIEHRRRELQLSCSPFTEAELDKAVAAISRMLSGFRSLRHDDDETAVAGLHGVLHALAPFPLWAIEAGCNAIHCGEAMLEGKKLSRSFPVNDPEVYAVVKEIVKPYLKILENTAALLVAPVQAEAFRR